MIVSSLKPGIVNLIKNTNGNHVAQRCLQYLTPEYREVKDYYLCMKVYLKFSIYGYC